jgi:2-dehydropantoate 2-reductase
MMSTSSIGIIGLGPVGTILGAYLARSGVQVYGVDALESRVEQVNNDGLQIAGFSQLHERAAHCFTTVEELSGVKDLRAVFICTKAWAIQSVMDEFGSLDWPEELRIVAFMNGIGPEDAIGAYIDKERICRGVVNYAGNLTPEGVVNMNWFHPPNLLGPATERKTVWAPEMEETLSRAGLTTKQICHHDMKKAAFFKTVLNSALNALCAAHGLTMGEAMRLKHTRRFAGGLLREGLTVAAEVGYNYGEDTLERCIAYLEAGGDHYPSMWFDLKNQRPTEIEYINGKIVKIGHMFKGIDVDLNLFFTSAIVTQEIKNGTRAETDIPEYLVDS